MTRSAPIRGRHYVESNESHRGPTVVLLIGEGELCAHAVGQRIRLNG